MSAAQNPEGKRTIMPRIDVFRNQPRASATRKSFGLVRKGRLTLIWCGPLFLLIERGQ